MQTKINADFTQSAIVHAGQIAWQPSPMHGVFRKPLDRVGHEVARATSIVRYEPGSHFAPHIHHGGEEFLVLEGVFQDEHGDYPAGFYIRNPPQSQHKPRSESGCIIFVKLWQFSPDDRTHIHLNSCFMQPVPHREYPGVAVTPLFFRENEWVALLECEPSTALPLDAAKGCELLVLEGELQINSDRLGKYSWLRLPCHTNLIATATSNGAKLWIKTGHLANVQQQLSRLPAISSGGHRAAD